MIPRFFDNAPSNGILARFRVHPGRFSLSRQQRPSAASRDRSAGTRTQPTTQPRRKKKRSKRSTKGLDVGITVLKIFIVVVVLFFAYMNHESLLTYLEAGLTPYERAGIPESVEIDVERVINFEVENAPISYNLTIPYPSDVVVAGETVQSIEAVEPDPPYNEIVNVGIDRYMLWSDTLEAGESMEIRIRYKFIAKSVKWDIASGRSAMVDSVPSALRAKYCKDEWPVTDRNGDPLDENGDGEPDSYRIEPTNPALKELAEQLVKDDDGDVYSMTKSIYDYLDSRFVYARGAPGQWPQSAMDSYRTMQDGENIRNGVDMGHGDCDDQSILFITLCRAVGIPAWLESGALYNQPTNQWEGHGWANVYIPTTEGGEQVATVDVVNNLFFLRDTDRLSEWEDNGNETRLMNYYQQWTYSYRGPVRPELTTSEHYITHKYDPTAVKTHISI